MMTPQAKAQDNWIEFQNSNVAILPLRRPTAIAPFCAKNSAETDGA